MPDRKPPSRWRKLPRFRPWIQAAFLPLWLAPIAWMRSIPGCVYHCYACPLASAACPIGLLANSAALHAFPFAVVGVLLVVGGLLGAMMCGWACPFGFLQELIAKVPLPKFRIPVWMGWGRYAVLAAFVLAVPFFLGKSHPLFICSICPAGAVEAALPRWIMGQVPWMSWYKTIILVALVAAALLTYRPWCTVLCPLGGIFSAFNRFSVVFLRFDANSCIRCRPCRTKCKLGLDPSTAVNTTRCIRCADCFACGAVYPTLAGLGKRK